ncbi:hypothetical protein ACJZ2D_015471 [Fusarium nematophilum]
MDARHDSQQKSYPSSVEEPTPGSRKRRVRPSRARGLRTSTGCLTCRKRRVKCDESKPRCTQCSKSDRECLYGQSSDASNVRPRAQETPSSPGEEEGFRATGSDGDGSPRPPFEPPWHPDGRLSMAPGSSFRATESGAIGSSATLLPVPSSGRPEDPVLEAANDDSIARTELGISPSAPSQISLLNISPFEWYDLLAQDAINNIQRLYHSSNGDARWHFDENALSRRQTPAPENCRGGNSHQEHALDDGRGSLPSLPGENSSSKPWNTTRNIDLSACDLKFLRYYIDVVGPILDLFDPQRHFTNVVPHLATRNTGLLKSMLAVAARHWNLGLTYQAAKSNADSTLDSGPSPQAAPSTQAESESAPLHVAAQYYYETLHYLSQTLLYPSYAESHEILATAIMISTYEMFDANGTSNSGDWERHLRGAFWIQRSQDNDGESADSLRRAVWWAWLRQDIWAAFRTGRPTLTIWRPRRALDELDPDQLATRIVYIAAKCLEFAALDSTSPDMDIRQRIDQGNKLLQTLQDWHAVLPPSYMPIASSMDSLTRPGSSNSGATISATPTGSGIAASSDSASKSLFPPVWIHPPHHAGAMQMYHFARAIVLLNQPTVGGLQAYRQRQARLNDSLHMICGIANACEAHEPGMAFVNTQAVFAIGQCVQMPQKQTDLLGVLENMMHISRFPDGGGLVAELTQVWQQGMP